jgi:hypothetical protein
MSTDLKITLDAEPRPLQLGAARIPARLLDAVEYVKSPTLAVHRLTIAGATDDAEIQHRVGEACAQVTDHLREHVEVNRPREDRVYSFCARPTPFRGQLGRLRAASTFASRNIAEGDDVKVMVCVGVSRPGPREVTAIYPAVLAEWFPIAGDRVAPGRSLVRLHSVAGAR